MNKFGFDIKIGRDKKAEEVRLRCSETGFIVSLCNPSNSEDDEELIVSYSSLEGNRYTNNLTIMEKIKKLTEEHYNNEFVLTSIQYNELEVKKISEIISKNISKNHKK